MLNAVLAQIYHFKRDNVVRFTRKNDKIRPFESGGEASLEFFSLKTDCSLFVVRGIFQFLYVHEQCVGVNQKSTHCFFNYSELYLEIFCIPWSHVIFFAQSRCPARMSLLFWNLNYVVVNPSFRLHPSFWLYPTKIGDRLWTMFCLCCDLVMFILFACWFCNRQGIWGLWFFKA